MTGTIRSASMLLAAGAALVLGSAAQAEYYIQPVLQYQAGVQNGLSRNDAVYGEQTFYDSASALESYVDLAAGTIKTYVSRTGPSNNYSIVSGAMGEQIRYLGAEDQAVRFDFDYDVFISADQYKLTDAPEGYDSRYIGISAAFAIYEAGTGANYASWTANSPYVPQALWHKTENVTFQDWDEAFSYTHFGSLGTELFLTNGKSYDIFAAFNLILTPGAMGGSVVMDALNTSTIGIAPPQGATLTSQSGAFLGLARTPAVPEPASWAMMIAGFALAGTGLRQRRVAVALHAA